MKRESAGRPGIEVYSASELLGERLRQAAVATLASLALLVGGLIYIAGRPESLRLFKWLRMAGLGDSIELLRGTALSDAAASGWILWSLPGGLWALSGALAMQLVWWRSRSVSSLLWCLAVPILGFASEIGQPWAISGSFDPSDLAAYVAAGAVAVLIAFGIGRRG